MFYVLCVMQLFTIHEGVLRVSEEQHELDIKRMLSLSGLTPLVEVIYYWTTMAIICLPTIIVITFIGEASVFGNVGVFVLFLLLILFMVQSTLQRTIMRWCIPNRLTRVLITVGYFILATLVTILTAFKPNTSKTEITLLSIFFPAQQVLFFAKMAIV